MSACRAGSPTGTMRVLPPLPSTRSSSPSKATDVDVELDELLGAQPAAVGDLEQRAVAQLERRSGGNPVEQRRELVGRAARAAGAAACAGDATSSAGFCSTTPCSRRARKQARSGGELARDGAGGGAVLRERRGVAAQLAGPASAGDRARRRRPDGELRAGRSGRRGGCGPRAPRRSEVVVEQAQRAGASRSETVGVVSSPAMAIFFIDTATGQVTTRNQLVETGVAPADGDPPRPWLPDQGDGRRDDALVRGDAAAGEGASSSAR